MPGWHSIHKNGFEMDHHLQPNLLTLLRKDADDILETKMKKYIYIYIYFHSERHDPEMREC
jgi:hypothetical protein